MEAKYFNRFKKLREAGSFTLRGSTLIIEIIPEEEIKTESGIILQTADNQRSSFAQNKPVIGVVLESGEGYYNEAGEVVAPCDTKPGAVVICPKFSTQYLSVFPGMNDPVNDSIAFVKEQEVLFYYPSMEAYTEARKALNETNQASD